MTPLNTIIEEEKKAFDEKIANYIRLVEVGQYNNEGKNIGFIPATQVIQNFLTTAMQRAYEAGREEALQDKK